MQILDLVTFVLAIAFLYHIVWVRIIKMYYIYWFYRRQGIPCIGFPLPIFGNLLTFLKVQRMRNHYSKTPLEDYFMYVFGPDNVPGVFLDMRDPRGTLIITDPKYLEDLYFFKNKFFEKAGKERRVYYSWFGTSFNYRISDETWQIQRKHLGAAFYKDKLNQLVIHMVEVANRKVQEMISNYGQGKNSQRTAEDQSSGPNSSSTASSRQPKVMCLAGEIADMLADSVLASIFG